MSGEIRELDAARVAPLAKHIMAGIVWPFRQGPEHADRVLGVMNALAFATASVLAGSSCDATTMEGCRVARSFFDLALQQNIDALMTEETDDGDQHQPADHGAEAGVETAPSGVSAPRQQRTTDPGGVRPADRRAGGGAGDVARDCDDE